MVNEEKGMEKKGKRIQSQQIKNNSSFLVAVLRKYECR